MGCKRFEISVTTGCLILVSAVVLLFPASWVVAWFGAAVIHELGHLIAISLSKNRQWRLCFGFWGPRIICQPKNLKQTFWYAAAGPAAGALCLLFARWLPRLAVCALVQTICNLLPVYPLDGGQILMAAASAFLKPISAERLVRWITYLILLVFGAGAIWVSIRFSAGIFPVLSVCLLAYKVVPIKFTCKESREGVQ